MASGPWELPLEQLVTTDRDGEEAHHSSSACQGKGILPIPTRHFSLACVLAASEGALSRAFHLRVVNQPQPFTFLNHRRPLSLLMPTVSVASIALPLADAHPFSSVSSLVEGIGEEVSSITVTISSVTVDVSWSRVRCCDCWCFGQRSRRVDCDHDRTRRLLKASTVIHPHPHLICAWRDRIIDLGEEVNASGEDLALMAQVTWVIKAIPRDSLA